jgi:hypothetical protein
MTLLQGFVPYPDPQPYPFALCCRGVGAAESFGARAVAADITPARLRELLTFPSEWGPSQWGPIPFLPEHDTLVRKLEAQVGCAPEFVGGGGKGGGR